MSRGYSKKAGTKRALEKEEPNQDPNAVKDPERAERLNKLGTDQEWEKKKRKKKEKNKKYGWAVLNSDSMYRAHKKGLQALDHSIDTQKDYEKTKQVVGDDIYRDVDDLGYGEAPEVPEWRLNALVKGLKEKEAKKAGFSRRRAEYEDQDISHINKRNKMFNKKLDRAYGSYTADIKAALERGTAL